MPTSTRRSTTPSGIRWPVSVASRSGLSSSGTSDRTSDLLAEDATQDAFAAALARWPKDGIPDRPAAWLTTVARNRAIDRIRSAKSEQSNLRKSGAQLEVAEAPDIDDDRLRLIFTCCHPALTPSPIVSLNRAIAVGMRDGPDAGLALLDEVTDELVGVHLVPAAKADLLRRAERIPEAAARYHEALQLAPTTAERAQLRQRLDRLFDV